MSSVVPKQFFDVEKKDKKRENCANESRVTETTTTNISVHFNYFQYSIK